MPVLHRVVGPVVTIAVTAALLCGCARFDAALGQRHAVVSFRPGTTVAQRLGVRSACARMPGVSVPPLPDLKARPYALQQVAFTVTHASDAQVAGLERCLQRFPVVAGVTLQDSSDAG